MTLLTEPQKSQNLHPTTFCWLSVSHKPAQIQGDGTKTPSLIARLSKALYVKQIFPVGSTLMDYGRSFTSSFLIPTIAQDQHYLVVKQQVKTEARSHLKADLETNQLVNLFQLSL